MIKKRLVIIFFVLSCSILMGCGIEVTSMNTSETVIDTTVENNEDYEDCCIMYERTQLTKEELNEILESLK